MALTILSSNRVETLQIRLAQVLAESPLSDPFQCESIVVPTFAMSRWLNLQLAQQQGIAANIDYRMPGRWIWQLAKNLLGNIPDQDPYTRENLGWSIFSLLPELVDGDDFESIKNYLRDDDNGIKRWQLSQRIGISFDRYLLYRPQMIEDWSKSNESRWQAVLWRRILQQSKMPHRAEMIAALCEAIAQASATQLPERISLFCISALPPLYLGFINALSERVDLRLYLHSPTDQYWADLVNQKKTLRQQSQSTEYDNWYENRNELLASWGKQGQVFQDLLLDSATTYNADIDLYQANENDSLLGKIQQSIFDLNSDSEALTYDDSISVHICHSAMRECQVLQDQLLAMLDADSTLSPEDILVMVPDIATYAPYIEATFRHQSDLRLACNISDVASADNHPQVTTLLSLLRLSQSRFSRSEMLALLDCESLCRKFDLDQAAQQEIQRMLDQTHLRWGIDAQHKTTFGLPAEAGNTWQQARQRLFAGYAFGDDQLWNGIAAIPGWDESNSEAIGRFWHFFDRLDSWRKRLSVSRSPQEWQTLLLQLVDDFFVETDPRESRLQEIRDIIREFASDQNCHISPLLIGYLLEQQLNNQQQSGGLYTGGVTFCGMRPMRSVPFRVICLLGMNQADFPRRDELSDFELLALQPAPSDPSNRVEDRYLMLETLLCARDKLYISYSGRSLKDNSPCQPSLLVEELLDFIDHRFHRHDKSDERFSGQLCQMHPMQVFSVDNYRPEQPGYNPHWFKVASQVAQFQPGPDKGWPDQPLNNEVAADIIELVNLQRFLRHPIEAFFRQRLGIQLFREETPADDEIFDLNKLDEWALKQELARDVLGRHDGSMERILAQGSLAHGHAAESQLKQIAQQHHNWLQALKPFSGIASRALPVEITTTDGAVISGVVNNYYPGKGLMSYYGGRFKGHQLLALWLDHLVVCAAGHFQDADSSLLISIDEHWQIEALGAEAALHQLEHYQQLYNLGMRLPLPVFPTISFAWAKKGDPQKALDSAEKAWSANSSQFPNPDRQDEYIGLVMRDCSQAPFADPRFDQFANALYGQLLQRSSKL